MKKRKPIVEGACTHIDSHSAGEGEFGSGILFAETKVTGESACPVTASKCLLRTSCRHFDHNRTTFPHPVTSLVYGIMHVCDRPDAQN